LVGRTLDVMNFGFPHPLCNHSAMGIRAVTGTSQVFFLFVAQSPSANDSRTLYQSSNACYGNFDPSGANKQVIANLLADSPANRIANPGSDVTCSLPTAIKTAPTVPATSPSPSPMSTSPNVNGTTSSPNSATGTRGAAQRTLWISAVMLVLVAHCLFV
jgi:hypothetical protein